MGLPKVQITSDKPVVTDARVLLDGVDISRYVSRAAVEFNVGEIAKVTLDVHPGAVEIGTPGHVALRNAVEASAPIKDATTLTDEIRKYQAVA